MEKLAKPPLIVGSDGRTQATETKIVAVSTADGQPVDAATQANIERWVHRANGNTAAQQLLAQQQGYVAVLMGIMQELGDKWELEQLDALLPKLRALADDLRKTPAYNHLRANGSLQPTIDAVHASATTREGRVQFAWMSLLMGMNQATGGITDLFATVLLWVPMLLLANATKDNA